MEEQHQQEILLAALLEKFLAGNCTEAEKVVVMEWYARYEDLPEEQPTPEVMHSIYEGLLHRLPEVTLPEEQPRIRRRMPTWIAAAAVVLLLILAGGIWQWVVYRQTHQLADTEGRFRNDVAPGVSKARLLMGNGDIVDLSATANGNIGLQGSAQVNKQDSTLVYQHIGNKGTKEVVYNTLEIPRGGQYCVVLPDGTRVWLNAASSLRFPTAFMGKTREVTLHGEGYFEVAKDAGHPFVVQLEKGAVEVLGTHFNITDYADEQTVATTLLEGAVRVQQGGAATILQPGEQSKWSRENRPPQVSKVDTEATIAWKNGLFTFSNTDINEVMRQLARWYDVEVVYEVPVNIRLNGMISRYSSLSQVLKILELTGEAHFTIAGKKITVKHQ